VTKRRFPQILEELTPLADGAERARVPQLLLREAAREDADDGSSGAGGGLAVHVESPSMAAGPPPAFSLAAAA